MVVATRPDERTVVGIWERQAFDSQSLTHLGLSVIYRGVPSDAGGPDYQDATFGMVPAGIIRGDVEFHVLAGDWYRHDHDRNPAYNKVALHVVWTQDVAETRRQDGISVPILALDQDPVASEAALIAAPARSLLPHPCVDAFANVSTRDLRQAIVDLGLERLRQRSSLFAADLDAEDVNQVAYRALLEGLGYASNRETFRALADVVPYGWLQSQPLQERTATLLDASRLGPPAAVLPPAHLSPDSWRLTRLRPANHPARRLEGMVDLLDRLRPSVARALLALVEDASSPADIRRGLEARSHDAAWIGSGRADELAVSVVLPFVGATPGGAGLAERVFLQYPSPPHNRWTRHMLELLRLAGHVNVRVRTAAEHQGLHHLYHQHCRKVPSADCTVCGVSSRTPEPAGDRSQLL
ncbi:MAG TPA: DUF2851 family protein [Chloroflexota bacterium]